MNGSVVQLERAYGQAQLVKDFSVAAKRSITEGANNCKGCGTPTFLRAFSLGEWICEKCLTEQLSKGVLTHFIFLDFAPAQT